MTDAAQLQLITLLTVIAGMIAQAVREARHRRWDLEDRARLADKVVTEAEKVATIVTGAASRLEVQTAGHVKQLTDDIAANTKVSTDAFHEANSVNMKIQKLGLEHNQLQQQQQQQQQQQHGEYNRRKGDGI
jgi:uncharacterized protein YpuA (DUF1002 family)